MIIYNLLKMQSEQKNFNCLYDTHDKQDSHTSKSQLTKEDKLNQKFLTKKQIRKEKNRLAAQKSRDKKQIHLQFLQKENKVLKEIINNCAVCSQKTQRRIQTQDREIHKSYNINTNQENPKNQEGMIQIQFQFEADKQNQRIEKSYFRYQDESSQNLSKFLTFCLVAALLCVAQISRQKYMNDSTRLLQIQAFNSQEQRNLTQNTISVPKKRDQKSLIGIKMKQCKKCMQCFQNITNATSNSLMQIAAKDNHTSRVTNVTNSLNKIILCKSKAAFFKKIYQAMEMKSKITDSKIRNIGKIQIKGKQILELVDKDCLTDIQFNQNKMYTVQFTLAIIELEEIKDEKNHFRNISIQQ